MDKRFRMTEQATSGLPPAVAWREVGDNLLIRIELPGVKAAEVTVSITADALTIRRDRVTCGRSQRRAPAGEAPSIVGASPHLQNCLVMARQAAATDTSVLIGGEAGTGKELLARFIHAHSRRAAGSFVMVACTDIPPAQMEQVLFGYATGARRCPAPAGEKGLVWQAHHGTLFLDEVGDLPLITQQAFLRALHRRSTRPAQEASDFRLIAATRRNLAQDVGNGRFCQELLRKLQACTIDLMPLRERTEDLGALARHFIDRLCRQHHFPGKQLTPEFLLHIAHYSWPGNVQELSTVLEQTLFSAALEPTLFPKHLPVNVRTQAARALWLARHAGTATMPPARRGHLPKLHDMRETVFIKAEHQYLHNLITLTGHDIDQACELAGLSRSRLYTLLKKHRITAH